MAGKFSTEDVGSPTYSPYPQLIEPTILRSILYFDTIDWPFSRPGGIPTGDRLKVLEEQRFLLRTPAECPHAMPANFDLLSAAHRLVFEQHETEEPGAWTFAHLLPEPVWGPKLVPSQQELVQLRGLDFELYRALPMPAQGVPYEDILDFEVRREAELLSLRAHLDALYSEIVNSRDIPRAKDTALLQLDASLRDLARVPRGAGGLRAFWGSVGITVLFDALRDVTATAKAAELFGQSATLGAEIGATGAAYKFSRRMFQSPLTRAGPLTYVARAAQEQLVAI